jgi:hypothetical protein
MREIQLAIRVSKKRGFPFYLCNAVSASKRRKAAGFIVVCPNMNKGYKKTVRIITIPADHGNIFPIYPSSRADSR